MTVDELRKYPNCGHYTDEQAKNIIHTLENLAVYLFDFTCLKYGIIIDNQSVIRDKSKENDLNIAA
ncbi:MAG: hypothetical protein K1X55_17260 [Chitinophagales bacterium]|nr:hypothetical protein [Chitinophagales bacterium]